MDEELTLPTLSLVAVPGYPMVANLMSD